MLDIGRGGGGGGGAAGLDINFCSHSNCAFFKKKLHGLHVFQNDLARGTIVTIPTSLEVHHWKGLKLDMYYSNYWQLYESWLSFLEIPPRFSLTVSFQSGLWLKVAKEFCCFLRREIHDTTIKVICIIYSNVCTILYLAEYR